MSNKRMVVRLLVVALLVFTVFAPTAALAEDDRATATGLACDGIPYNPGDDSHVAVGLGPTTFYEVDPDGVPFNGNEELVALVDLSDRTSGVTLIVNFLDPDGPGPLPGNSAFPDWNGAVDVTLTNYDDLACVGEGASWVLGLDGDDTIYFENDGMGLFGPAPAGPGVPFFAPGDWGFGGDGDDLMVAGFSAADIPGTLAPLVGATFWGGMGEDVQVGGIRRDVFFGGAGDDTQWGMRGPDTLWGNAGNDALYGNQPRSLLDGLPDEGVSNRGLFGGPGDDLLVGGEGGEGFTVANPLAAGLPDGISPLQPSLIPGLGGLGMAGGTGDDTIMGAPMAAATGYTPPFSIDVANGGPGDDFIEGYNGPDVLIGATGADTIFGHSAAAFLDGLTPDGNNIITGSKGDDALFGSSGVDQLLGQGNQDLISGDFGNDFIGGGSAADTLFGDFGIEVTFQGDRGKDLMYADTGTTADVAGGVMMGGKGADEIHGDDGPDIIWGDDIAGPGLGLHTGDDVIYGHDGPDILIGGLGDDELRGGDDIDNIWGEQGADTLYGGAGDDLLEAQWAGDLLGDLAVDDMFGGFGNDVATSVCTDPDSFTEFDGESGPTPLGDTAASVQFLFGEIELTLPAC